MKVLLVTHRYPPDGVGGVERYVEAVSDRLASSGDEVTVLTRKPTHLPRRPKLRVRASGRARVLVVEGSGVRLDDPLARHIELERVLAEVLSSVRPDVVHVNHLIGLSPLLPAQARDAGSAVVVSLHDYYFACPLVHLEKIDGRSCAGPRGGLECGETCFARQSSATVRWTARARYFRELLLAVDRVVVPTPAVASYFQAFAEGLEPVVLPLGVIRAEPLAVRPTEAQALRLLVLGSVARHKGADLLIEAVSRALLGAVTLTLAGRVEDDRYAASLRAAADAAGVDLRFTGPYQPDELGALLGACDLVVFPSRAREVYPLAPREALAAGVPVLAVRTGALEEYGDAVMLVDSGDADKLAAALQRIAMEEGLLRQLRDAAASTTVLTTAEHVDRLRQIFTDAVSTRSALAPTDREEFRQLVAAFRS